MRPSPLLLAAAVLAPALAGCAGTTPPGAPPLLALPPLCAAPATATGGPSQVWSMPLPGGRPALSSPVLVDADSDGILDVVVGTGLGTANATNATAGPGLAALRGTDGSIAWATADGTIDASPSLGDLNGDGLADIVVGARARGELLVLNPRTGAKIASLALANWVQTAALTDLDGDGVQDVVAATGGLENAAGGSGRPGELVRVRGSDFQPLWRVRLADESYSSPATATVGDKPMAWLGLGGQLHRGGGFEAYDAHNGQRVWNETTQTGVLSSPAVADLDGDGQLEVIFAEWWGAVHVRGAADGKPRWDAALGQLVWSSPAVGDLNGDGHPDVVVSGYRTPDLQLREFQATVNDKPSLRRGNAGILAAYDGPTGRPLWVRDVDAVPGTPVIADVDGDGRLDVVVACTYGSAGFFGTAGGSLAVLAANGTDEAVLPLPAGAIATPAIGDVDKDGKADIVVATMSPGHVVRIEFPHATSGLPGPWPRFRGNERGTGQPG